MLIKSIYSAHEVSHDTNQIQDGDFAWKHQIILGTLHSFVVLGNQKNLDFAIQQALRSKSGQSHLDMAIQKASVKQNPRFLNPTIIDAIDESGKTALHYACESRFSTAVVSLVKAGADVNLRLDAGNMSPCHICARNLDFKSLESIMAVSQRPNEVDYLGRSPLYIAITEGRLVGGQSNPLALERCIETIAKFGGGVGALLENRHPASFLASQFQADELSIILKYSQFKYPLRVTKEEDSGISLSALYQYPVHSALISLKRRLHDFTSVCDVGEQLWRECALVGTGVNKTLNVLFSFGFEPNERIEGLSTYVRGVDELLDHIGFTPMQIIFSATLDTLDKKKNLDEIFYVKIADMLVNVMECLFLHGGRVFPEPPPAIRTEERSQESTIYNSVTAREEGAGSNDALNRSQVKTQGSDGLTMLLDSSKLTKAKSFWRKNKPALAPSNVVLHNSKSKIENSLAPGGSDDRSCSICWKKFGMMTRKHRCRISCRFICDECSTRRILCHDEEHRVSDGQFLLFKAEELKEKNRMNAVEKQELNRKQPIHVVKNRESRQEAIRSKQLKTEENSDRESLFSGMVDIVTKTLGGTEGAKETSKNEFDTLDELSNQLNQTRDVLNKRGDKLSTLSDKSDKLVSASQDFAAMAKELNRKSNQSFFSW